MAELVGLVIRGIRAFSPDRGEKIMFSPPLTLIVGENGAGKTTIIECLRYCTTGEVPPGVGAGAAWLHDPSLTTSTETKAQVKLMFTTRNKKVIELTRNLSVTQRPGQRLTFKTLESALQMKSDNNEKASLSTKCAEIDKEVPELMGVSKAILDHVIFCHQEDSNWPLTESDAKLRERFDEIFAATRYTKALEEIKKQKKELAIKSKELEGSVKAALAYKTQAQEIANGITKYQAEIEAVTQEIRELAEKAKDIENALQEKRRIYQEHNETFKNIGLLTGKLSESQKQLEAMRQALLEELPMSDEELQSRNSEIDSELRDLETQTRMIQERKTELSNKREHCDQQLQHLHQEFGKVQSIQEELLRQQQQIEATARTLITTLRIKNLEFTEINEEIINQLLQTAQAKLQAAQQKLNNEKQKYAQTIKEQENIISDMKAQQAQLQGQLQSDETTLVVNEAEIQQLRDKIEKTRTTMESLENLRATLQEKQKELSDLKQMDVTKLEHEAQEAEQQKKDRELRQRELSLKLKQVQEQKLLRAKLDAKKEELKKALDMWQKFKDERHEAWKRWIPEANDIQPTELVEKLRSVLEEKKQQWNTQLEAKEKAAAKAASLEGEITQATAQLELMQTTVSKKQAKLGQFAGKPINEMIQQLEASIAKNKKKLVKSKAVETLYSRFIEKTKAEHQCPLCNQSLQDEEKFIDGLREIIGGLPAKISHLQKIISESESQKEHLQSLLVEWQDISRLVEVDIPRQEAKINELRAQASTITSSIPTQNELCRESELAVSEIEELLRSLTSTMHAYETAVRLEREIGLEEEKLGLSAQSDVDYAQLSQEIEVLAVESEQLAKTAFELRQRAAEITTQIHKKELDIKEIEASILAAQTGDQTIATLESRLEQLLKHNTELLTHIEEKQQKVEEYNSSINNHTASLEKLKEEAAQSEARHLATFNKATKIVSEFESIYARIKEIQSRSQDPVALTSAIQVAKMDAEELARAIAEADEKLASIQQQVAEKQREKRNVEDNIRYREAVNHTKQLSNQLAQLKTSSTGVRLDLLQNEIDTLSQELSNIKIKLSRREGDKEATSRHLAESKAKLESPLYKDADEKYRAELINYKTTTMAAQDLELYSKALSDAIMRYHRAKISEINRMIKELWEVTYKGKDIDTIEIVAETIDPTGPKNRQHNYRVMMVKGSTTLDMRGRCSAGQKVLASLVIRLALADAFGLNCGILALDEPTTNLDRHNVESLATSLASLIESRRAQKNFQLIIITHDEEFVEMLSRASKKKIEYYYRVTKDATGASRIEKRDFDI